MMSIPSDAVWLQVSPSLKCFDKSLLRYLSFQGEGRRSITQWEYSQTPDEPCSLEVATVLLHDYLKTQSRPVHLMGHSTGGLVGLLYARQYPERVKSLTLLAVGVNPTINWQAHYYVQRQLLPCSRHMILTQMARSMMGQQAEHVIRGVVRLLERDLNCSPSPHSLLRRVNVATGGVSVPMFVGGCSDDIIVDFNQLQGWKAFLGEGSHLWKCEEGGHFFHHFCPEIVGEKILEFWASLSAAPKPSASSLLQSSLQSC